MGNAYERIDDDEVVDYGKQKQTGMAMGLGVGLLIALVLCGVLVAVYYTVLNDDTDNTDNSSPFTNVDAYVNSLTSANIMVHLQAFQDIANRNGGTRSVGTSGYTDSVQYVYDTLQTSAVCDPEIQEFVISEWNELSPSTFKEVQPQTVAFADFSTMQYSGAGNVTAAVAAPTNDPMGCTAADFTEFPTGRVAVVQRGNCEFSVKSVNAFAAGAVGVLIYNEGNNEVGVVTGTLGFYQDGPVFGIPYQMGLDLLDVGATVNMFADTAIVNTTTANVVCTWPAPDGSGIKTDKQIIVGSHLDSVPAGPGINDNGSGSATNLELAIQASLGNLRIQNQVIFCWWGAEEIGLKGSAFYVESRQESTTNGLDKIAMNLNFDMTASPNYVNGVYNGSDADDPSIREASGNIEQLFVDYYVSQNIPYTLEPFTGRSDYGPFIEVGIPAGGLFTGAEEEKSMEERSEFGGLANAAYDPCYHQSCDTIDNVNTEALQNNARAAAFTLGNVATLTDIDAFIGDEARSQDAMAMRDLRAYYGTHYRGWWKDIWE
mmetsp:Transcript_6727/g.19022  ORF Transcript_6727/g.19022 Transcript_6727/m.19022 type:complete len:544 (-) Transcript_6727:44-1675(-)|eukprot:CAMPEP_0119118718 /NCGR_PEP_ID=MMETSP1310-20130426/490_1 /TAXON_ID=464262 /ORGANISM="Genus nov. species nov., Strain RCC2339" /LENGTH=543 /DNA_ID=CAMNT_0007108105 /DNA_START=112 /DNA_END=1743 /DNA_ORIENTATION=-